MFDSSMLAGKIALVTMSTFGMGMETAEQLGRAGAAAVVINGRNETTGREVAARLSAAAPGTRYVFISADITNATHIESLFARIVKELGGLDIMVHAGTAVGGGTPEPFVKVPPSTYTPMTEGL